METIKIKSLKDAEEYINFLLDNQHMVSPLIFALRVLFDESNPRKR